MYICIRQIFKAFNIYHDLSIVHFNHRSHLNNFEEIKHYLNQVRFALDVITISETWINTKQKVDTVQLPGNQLSSI